MKAISIGYKQTEVEVIPSDWKLDFLAKNASIFRGGSPRPIEAFITTSPEGVNWIKIGDVSANSKYIKSTSEKIIASGVKHSRAVRAGDLLLSNSMSYGRPYILCIDGCIHDGWLTISNYEREFEKEFLCYILGSECVSKQYSELAAGTGVKNLNKQIVGKVLVPYPASIKEQRAIATALSDMDDLIEAKRALLEKKRAIKQGAMQELMTGKRRLPGFPVTPKKHTEIGDLPDDWEVKELGSLACMKSGQSITGASIEENGDYPCYGGNGLRGYTKTYTHEGTFPLIGRQGALCGNVTLARNRFYASEHAVVVTPYQGVDAEWMSRILVYMNLNSISEASAQGGLAVSKILKLKAPFPQPEEQCAIAAVLSDMDVEIESLEQELVKLCNLKQGMMQNLLTGRIRLV